MPAIPSALSRRLPFYYGWVVVAVGFVSLGMGASVRTIFGLLFPPILSEFGWERALTASVFSIGFFVAAIASPLIGTAIDRFGPQRVLPVGAIISATGFYLTTLATEPHHFYLTLGLMCIGGSTVFAYNGHFVFVPSWFERSRGLALGLVSAGAGVVGITLVPELQKLIDRGGWRTGCIVFAVILLVLIVPVNLALQCRRPQDLGLEPDGGAGANAGGTSRTVIVDRAWASTDWTLGKAARTARFWCFAIGFGLALFAWYAILVHQTKYLRDLGFNSTFAAWALGLVPFFGVGGQIVLGTLSDRIGREWVWTLGTMGFFSCYLCMLLLARWPDPLLVWGMVVTQGFFGYGISTVIGAIPADLFQGRNYGRIYGVMAIGGSSGASLGPWVLGYVFDKTGSYDIACMIQMAACVLSCLLIWLAAPRKVRAIGRAAQSAA